MGTFTTFKGFQRIFCLCLMYVKFNLPFGKVYTNSRNDEFQKKSHSTKKKKKKKKKKSKKKKKKKKKKEPAHRNSSGTSCLSFPILEYIDSTAFCDKIPLRFIVTLAFVVFPTPQNVISP